MPSREPNPAVNRTKPDRWKADIINSVDMYNEWFMRFAPTAYRETRMKTSKDVEATLLKTTNLTDVSPALLLREPGVLPTLRMQRVPRWRSIG